MRQWRAGHHSDGSCGWEVVTAPIAGPHIEACVRALADGFRRAGAVADERCGVHVHVDAKDLMWQDMFRLLWVYARVEPLLYVIAGQQRLTNTYCKPAGRAFLTAMGYVDRKGGVLATAYEQSGGYRGDDGKVRSKSEAGRAYNKLQPGKKDAGRYKGLNIVPWLCGRRENANNARNRIVLEYVLDASGGRVVKNGRNVVKRWADANGKPIDGAVKPIKADCTVEFRIHRNTLDAERLSEWALLCMRLVDWCAKASDSEAQALPRSALRCLAIIAPESLPFILKRIRAWRTATRRFVATTGRPRTVPRRISCKGGRWRITNTSGHDGATEGA